MLTDANIYVVVAAILLAWGHVIMIVQLVARATARQAVNMINLVKFVIIHVMEHVQKLACILVLIHVEKEILLILIDLFALII